LSVGWAPPDPGRKGRMEGKRREGSVGEGVPECPNPELASLSSKLIPKTGAFITIKHNSK